MKKKQIKKIDLKKLTIAAMRLKRVYGGHVNPPPVTEEEGCFPTREECVIDKLF